MKLEYILKDLILERSQSITGDEDAHSLAKGDEHLGNVEKRLGKLGIGVASMEKFFTLTQLAVEPFKITIRTKTKDGDDQNLDLPEYMNYSFLGIIDRGADNKTNLNVKLKDLKTNVMSSMIFSESELFNVIPGTKDKYKSLVVGNEYNVKYNGTLNSGTNPKDGKDGGDDKDGGKGDTTSFKPPSTFLGNQAMKLGYLTKLFSKEGKDLESLMGIKSGTKFPESFLDRALKKNKDKIGDHFDTFLEGNSFTIKMKPSDKDEWVNKITEDKETLGVINWVRSTRKGIETFESNLKKNFPSFELSDRVKRKSEKPGSEMGGATKTTPLNQSMSIRHNLIKEDVKSFSKYLNPETVDLSVFMKNLTSFMEFLGIMYGFTFNREAVYNECKNSNCKKYVKEESVEESIQSIVQRIVEDSKGEGQDETLTISIVSIDIDQKAQARKGKDVSSLASGGGSGGNSDINTFNQVGLATGDGKKQIKANLSIKMKSISEAESGAMHQFNGNVLVNVSKFSKNVLIIESEDKFGDIKTPYLKVQIEDPTKPFTQQTIQIAKGAAGDSAIGELEYESGAGDFILKFK